MKAKEGGKLEESHHTKLERERLDVVSRLLGFAGKDEEKSRGGSRQSKSGGSPKQEGTGGKAWGGERGGNKRE